MEDNTADVTVSAAVPLIDPDVAMIVVLPTVKPVARPVELMVATTGEDEPQVTDDVKSCVLASE
jgi:hypothetical protein